MKTTRSTVLALTSLLALPACASGPGPQNTYSGADGKSGLEEEVGDPFLAQELLMESILTERRAERLHVQFNLRNTRSSELSIEWAIVWLDPSGFRLDGPDHWTPATIGGAGFETIARTATSKDASGFKLEVRRPADDR